MIRIKFDGLAEVKLNGDFGSEVVAGRVPVIA